MAKSHFPAPFSNSSNIKKIRENRLAQFYACWDTVSATYKSEFEQADLSKGLVARVVEHYIEDRTALVNRYRITGRIQRHKVAGLMTSSIMRYRPARKIGPDMSGLTPFRGNEQFAILHGLAICSEGQSQREIDKWIKRKNFKTWFKDFAYHLNRNYTAEGLVMIYETFCLCHIPVSLRNAGD